MFYMNVDDDWPLSTGFYINIVYNVLLSHDFCLILELNSTLNHASQMFTLNVVKKKNVDVDSLFRKKKKSPSIYKNNKIEV